MKRKIVLARHNVLDKDCLTVVSYLDEEAVDLEIRLLEDPSLLGNIYIAKVEKIMPEIGGAFLRLGQGKTGFLSLRDLPASYKLTCGCDLAVEVVQEALKGKPPKVTPKLSLGGKHMILRRMDHGLGVSRKLDKEERERIEKLLKESLPDDLALIVRTSAGKADDLALKEEFHFLLNEMKSLLEKEVSRVSYSLLKKARPFYLEIVEEEIKQALSQGDRLELVTDDPGVYDKLNGILSYDGGEIDLRFYQDASYSLAKLYSLTSLLEEAQKVKVWLKSGAYLMVEQTEAFVAVDVNSGKARLKFKDKEAAYMRVNKEAAREIARQLRLRNLYGMILVDFINMKEREDREDLFQYLKTCTRQDPASPAVVDITGLQITEMTRKKRKKSLREQLSAVREG